MRYCRSLSLSLSMAYLSTPPVEPPGVIERSLLQVGGSLTPDHELRIITVRGDRLSSGMHRSCAYYYYSLIGAYPYKSHANIPQTRNSLSLRPPQIAHVQNALHPTCARGVVRKGRRPVSIDTTFLPFLTLFP